MSVYMTEAEQLEAIKKWWKRHNNIITVILSVILLIVSIYKYWTWHEAKVAQQASNTYEHMMVAFSNQDKKGVKAFANQLIQDYSRTIYADAAYLTLAKLAVIQEKYPQAEQALQYVAEHSKMLTIQHIAKIRLARLLAAKKSYEKALAELATVDGSTYMPVVYELKGDIYAAMGQYQKAVIAYRKAISDVQTHGMGNLFLEMKTNELASRTTAGPSAENKGEQAV